MKMTTSKLKLKDLVKGESSRNTGIEIREYILSLLEKSDDVEIDLEDANFTPSM